MCWVFFMKRIGKKFQSYREMDRYNKREAVFLSPEQRLHNLTRLKKQYMALNDMTPDELDGHLRASTIKKVPLPWVND